MQKVYRLAASQLYLVEREFTNDLLEADIVIAGSRMHSKVFMSEYILWLKLKYVCAVFTSVSKAMSISVLLQLGHSNLDYLWDTPEHSGGT